MLAGPSLASCFNSADGMGMCLRGKMSDAGILPPPAVAVAEPTAAPVADIPATAQPDVAIAEPELDVTLPAQTPAVVPDNLIAATFGLLRAEPDGSVVIAGSGTPGSEVEVYSNDQLLGKAKVEATGDWVLVPDAPIPPGGTELTLGEAGKPGRAAESFVVAINDDKTSEPLVVASTPGQASDILQGLARPPAGTTTEVAVADPQPKPAAETPAAPEPAPAAEPAPQVPAANPPAAAPEFAPEPPATEPPAATAEPVAEPPVAQVPATPDAAVPDVAATEPSSPDTPAADAPAAGDAPPVSANGAPPTVGTTPSAEPATAQATPPTEPAAPDIALAAADPAVPKPPEPAPVLANIAPTIDAIEIEGQQSFFAGGGPDGAIVRLYVDGKYIADATVEGGRWLVEAGNVLTKPTQRIRIDMLKPDSAEVAARAEVDFEVQVPAGPATAVAEAEPVKPRPRPTDEPAPIVPTAPEIAEAPPQNPPVVSPRPESVTEPASAETSPPVVPKAPEMPPGPDIVVASPQNPPVVTPPQEPATEPTPVETTPPPVTTASRDLTIAGEEPATPAGPAAPDEKSAPPEASAEIVASPGVPEDKSATLVNRPAPNEPLAVTKPVDQSAATIANTAKPQTAGTEPTPPVVTTPAVPEPGPLETAKPDLPAPAEPQSELPAAVSVETPAVPLVTAPTEPVGGGTNAPAEVTATDPPTVATIDTPAKPAVDVPTEPPVETAETAPVEPAAPIVEDDVPTMVAIAVGDPEAARFASGKAIIRRGDNLWTIARRVYGAGIKYTTIYEANTGQIRNPNRIYPGQVFDLPDGAE